MNHAIKRGYSYIRAGCAQSFFLPAKQFHYRKQRREDHKNGCRRENRRTNFLPDSRLNLGCEGDLIRSPYVEHDDELVKGCVNAKSVPEMMPGSMKGHLNLEEFVRRSPLPGFWRT